MPKSKRVFMDQEMLTKDKETSTDDLPVGSDLDDHLRQCYAAYQNVEVLESFASNNALKEDVYVTSVKSYDYAYTWEINNFSSWLTLVEGQQNSPKFPHDPLDGQVQWYLMFNRQSKDDETFCSLYVALASKQKQFVKCSISMLDSEGNTIVSESLSRNYGPEQSWGISKFVNRETLLEKIKMDDILYIKCKIKANSEIVGEQRKGKNKPVPDITSNHLSSDLKTLVDEGKFGDFTILVGNQRFLVYKGILAARSSVFAAMFEHEMKENVENSLTINDVEPDVFKALLLFIYTDNCATLKTMVHKLYVAADKYDVQRLKFLCRQVIIDSLNCRNVADTLLLAEFHNDQEIKQEALQFFKGSVAFKATETDGWKDLVKNQPNLVDEIVRSLSAVRINANSKE